jgi:hypothetical protein
MYDIIIFIHQILLRLEQHISLFSSNIKKSYNLLSFQIKKSVKVKLQRI